MKQCRNCLTDKEATDFYSGKNTCKACYSISNAKFYQNNKNSILEPVIVYRSLNKEKIRILNSDYYRNNKEQIYQQQSQWYGKYRKSSWDDSDQLTWTWQLDHIIPQSNLPYVNLEDENFKKCWALDNLRPLSSKQNILLGTRLRRRA